MLFPVSPLHNKVGTVVFTVQLREQSSVRLGTVTEDSKTKIQIQMAQIPGSCTVSFLAVVVWPVSARGDSSERMSWVWKAKHGFGDRCREGKVEDVGPYTCDCLEHKGQF